MGCVQSKVDGEEAVNLCKERKLFMKQAVAARNAFASAHSAYAVALRDTGAAIHDYGQVEAQDVVCVVNAPEAGPSSSAPSATPVKSPMDSSLPPPPPPPPEYASSPLQRSVSMPDLPVPKFRGRKSGDHPFPADSSIREEDGDELEGEERRDSGVSQSSAPAPPSPWRSPQPPPQTPPPGWDFFYYADDGVHGPPPPPETEEIRPEKDNEGQEADKHRRTTSAPSASASASAGAAGADDGPPPPSADSEKMMADPPDASKPAKRQKGLVDLRRSKMVAATTSSISLLEILVSLDDHFLKAYESAQNVSSMLEAKRLHYHSNFADNRGHIDHSARVMRAITWNRSFKGLAAEEGRDDFVADSLETHATILDKLLAWEKKLFDEVKASERMKLDYQRKVTKLNRQKKHGASSEVLAATKAEVSHLHTRYIVDMQSMDSTVSEIQRLRDVQLYEKLTHLIRGMAEMWEGMLVQHQAQLRRVQEINAVDVSNALRETSDHLRGRTSQLCDMAARWSKNFDDLITHKKKYVKSLNEWLRLSLIPIENSLTEKVSSPTHQPPPPSMKKLLQLWHEQLEKIPEERAKTAIGSFAAVVKAILEQQDEELKQKERCEELNKDYIKKRQAFEDWHQNYLAKRPLPPPPQEEDLEPETGEVAAYRDLLAERQVPVELARKKVEDEAEKHRTLCKQAREKSVNSLKIHLPELFRAMTEFSRASAQMYKTLSSLNHPPAS